MMTSFADLSRQGPVFVLTLKGTDDHRLNPETMQVINKALDEVENSRDAAALVTTNEGKFYSNGLDLKWLQANRARKKELFDNFHSLLRRFLCFPIPTVAAICGHAAAGGCMIALAHDYRVMRRDKGFIFMNEVDIGLPLSPGMNAVVKCKVPVETYRNMILAGKRYDAGGAAAAGIVDEAVEGGERPTLAEAVRRATELAKRKWDRSIYQVLKLEMYKDTVSCLDSGDSGYGKTHGFISKM